MSLAKQILICITQVLCVVCFAQTKTIDSLKNVLPLLKDTSRIDCLNELSFQYKRLLIRDSAEYFESHAYKEAEKLNYVHGIAVSMSNQSGIFVFFDNDFIKAEAFARKSLWWFEKTNNKSGIENTNSNLFFSLFAQSKYDEAYIISLKKYENSIKLNDTSQIIYALGNLGMILEKEGKYDSAFYFYKEAENIATISKNKLLISELLYSFATLYRGIGDYQSAINNYRKIFQTDTRETIQKRVHDSYETWIRMEFADLFALTNQYDSAWHYYNLFDTGKVNESDLRIYLVSTGETYLLQKNYIKALPNLLRGLAMHRKLNDRNEIKRSLLDVARVYLALSDYKQALSYAKEGLDLSLQTKSRQFVRDAFQVIYLVYDHLHQTDSAYFYYQKYIVIKGDVVNDQTKGMFAANKYQEEIKQINNEKLISNQQLKFQQQQIKNEALLKNILIVGILVLILLGIVFFRYYMIKRRNKKLQLENELKFQKLESERTKAELQHQATKLEMQALRAQMNPHFIFNCLSSINRFILVNRPEEASDYLTKFSRLIRMVLHNSEKSFITLENEIEALRLYLDLEQLRFKNSFNYNITFCNTIELSSVFVPPMLIQPFVENAIWHGLQGKNNGNGEISIDMKIQDNILQCSICDNGIGRSASVIKKENGVSKKSLGINLTQRRLQLIDPLKQNDAGIEFQDIEIDSELNTGTCVRFKIPVNYTS